MNKKIIPLIAIFVSGLLFYLLTMQPSLAWGDGLKIQREAILGESFVLVDMVTTDFAPDPYPFARLGVAAWDHPLHAMLGYGLVHLAPTADSAWLITLISAIFGAITIFLVWYLVHKLTQSAWAATYAAVALAVSHTFWWHSATPEVYTLLSALILGALVLYLRYLDRGRYFDLWMAALLLGLAGASHLLAWFALIAIVWFHLLAKLWQKEGFSLTWWRWLGLGVAVNLGMIPFWMQLGRMLRTFSLQEVLGPAIGKTFLSGSLALSPKALLISLVTYGVLLLAQFGPLGVAAGVAGWRQTWQKRLQAPTRMRWLWLYLAYTGFGIIYTVTDQFAFFLMSHLFFAIGMGIGAGHWLREGTAETRKKLYSMMIVSLLAMPLLYSVAPRLAARFGATDAALGIPEVGSGGVRDGFGYYINPNKRGDRTANAFGYGVFEALPPESLIIAEWYVDTDEYFVFRYLQRVDGLRPDVMVEGWPTADPFAFESALVVDRVSAEIDHRPIYLASLSPDYYSAEQLLKTYCIIPQHQLYRVLPRATGIGDGVDCLETID